MKKLLFVFVLLAVQNLYAQDTLVTSPKYREVFESVTGGFREDLYKLTKEEFDKMYTKGQRYKVLIVYSDPLSTSKEEEITFRGLVDLCTPSSTLEVYNFRQPNRPGYVYKSGLETFVFDGKYIFRKEAVGPYNQDSAWGILILNGPISTVKTFGVSAYNSGKDGYSTKKYKFTLQKKMKSEFSVSFNDPHKEESNTRFKARMGMNFKECDEIMKKVEADTPGYGRPDLLKMILEYNEYMKNNDKEYWEASVYPKVQFFRK